MDLISYKKRGTLPRVPTTNLKTQNYELNLPFNPNSSSMTFKD